MKDFLDKIVKELKLNVVGECSHQFQKNNYPYGATMVYLSSESHLSVHTFVDDGEITLDLFTCDISLEDRNVKKSFVITLASVRLMLICIFLRVDENFFI